MESLSYLISILIFVGPPTLLEIIFGFHMINKYLKPIMYVSIFMMIMGTVSESFALIWKAWDFDPSKNIGITIFNNPIESAIYSFVIGFVVSAPVVLWTHYEDNKKFIITESFKDVFKGTFAIWRKSART